MSRQHEVEFLGPWLQDVIKIMDLTHWEITFAYSQNISEDGAHAEARLTPGRNEVTILIGDSYLDLPAADKRAITAHELLHLHARPIAECRHRAVQNFGMVLGHILASELHDAEEWMVDSIAMFLGSMLPVPPA